MKFEGFFFPAAIRDLQVDGGWFGATLVPFSEQLDGKRKGNKVRGSQGS